MKKFYLNGVLALAFVFCMVNVKAQLSGTYTIDKSKAASSTNYTSFTDAVSDLVSGTRTSGTANGPGVKGAVVFNVANDSFHEAIQIDTITGASATNNITFKSASGDSSKVILIDTTGAYTVFLNGADFITFSKMTIMHDITNGHVLQIEGGADSNRFYNNRLIGMKSSGTSWPYPCVIWSGTYPYTIDSANWFINNVMENGVYTAYWLGSYNGLELGNRFIGNTISGAYYGALFTYYQDNLKVIRNKISLANGGYGIFAYAGSTTTDSSFIANNFISTSGGSYSYGIYVYEFDLMNVYCNNIYNDQSNGYCAYMYAYNSKTSVNVMNNNFANMGGGIALAQAYNSYGITYSDYNNIYSTGSNIGQWNFSNVATLSDWQSSSGMDANSVSVDPLYRTKTDLHVGNVSLNNKGSITSSIKDDIDGEARGSKPDIGADEFTPKADDAGVVSVDSPGLGSCGGTKDVWVTVFNYGTSVLKSFKIEWAVNGTTQTAYTYSSGTGMSVGGRQSFKIGSYAFTYGSSYKLVAYTTTPNGVSDSVHTNDTAWSGFATNGMKGTYKLGGTSPDYATFTDAVTDLTSRGVCSAVTFDVADGVYTETVMINSIFGTSATNTVLFRSKSNDSTKVNLDWPASTTWGSYTVGFNGCSYVTFSKMTLTRSVASTSFSYGNVVDIRGGSNYNTVTNCDIHAYASYGYPVYSGQDNDNYNTIRNNIIYNGDYAVYLYGNSEVGNVIEGNIVDSVKYYGIMLYYNSGFKINKNIVKGVNYNYGIGIYIYSYNQYGGSEIIGNKVMMDMGQAGIYAYYVAGASGDSCYVYNNFVSLQGSGGSTPYGMYFYSSDFLNFYHNNILVTSNNSSGSALYFVNYNTNTSNIVYNNNCINTGGGYAIYSNNSTITDADNNNYYITKAANLGYWNGTDCKTLSDWKSTSSLDANSKNLDPKYKTNTDLHILNVALNGVAKPVNVFKDIDGQTRNASKPDIGADEIFPVGDDAGVYAIDSPKLGFCAGSKDVYARVFNFGTNTLTSCSVHWSINGTAQTSVAYSGSIAVGGSVLVKLGNSSFATTSKYKIVSYTTLPNGTSDVVHENDTAVSLIQTGLSGTLTIGASGTYTTFTAAADDLNNRGVCSATTIVADDGLYTEQIKLYKVQGTSAVNTVTFTSKSADSTKVILDYPSGSTTKNYVVWLNGTSFITFEKMTFSRSAAGSNYGTVIQVDGNSGYNTFRNSIFNSLPGTSGYPYMSYIFYSGGDIDSFNTIKNNGIHNGYYSFYWMGVSSNIHERGTVIENNTIDSSTYGNMLYYQSNLMFKKNSVRDLGSYGYPFYGYYCYGASQIVSNILFADKYYSLINYYCDGGKKDTFWVANNMISSNLQYTWAGTVYIYYCDHYYFAYNSIQNTNTGNTVYWYANTSTNNYSYNNIIYNGGGGTAYYIPNTIKTSNYNDIFSNGGNTGYWNGTTCATFSDWKTASSQDKNSISVDPAFFAIDDLHTKKFSLNGKAKVLSKIQKDIDGDPRDPASPDIGADEFGTTPNDVGVDSIITPYGTTCGDSHTVITVQVGNFGTLSQSNIPVYVSVNGGTPLSGSLIGPLASAKDSTYTFKTTINTFAGGTYTFKAYTALKGDKDSTNDTMVTTVTFNKASTLLSTKGVTNCTPGIYKLAAKVSSSKDTVYWYSTPTGGTSVGVGDTFKTPFLYAPATYYAVADAIRKTAGLANTAAGGATLNNSTMSYGLTFDAINDFILNDVTIYPDKSGTIVVNVYDNGSSIVASRTVSFTITKAYNPVKINLGISIPAGTGYYIESTGSSGFSYLRGNNSATKVNYPYYGGNLVAITGSYGSGGSNDYYSFYNWNVSNYSGCPSNRVAVKANIGGVKADFSFVANCSNNTVAFADSTKYAVGKFASRKWSFGDTKTDTAKNPVHKYASSSSYYVKLSVTSSAGCTDTAVKTITFGTAPVAAFSFTDACFNNANTFKDLTSFSGGYTRAWKFGDGSFDTSKNTSHTYAKAGSFSATLVVVSSGGCSDSIKKTVSVFDNPKVNFGATASCVKNPVGFVDSTTLNGTTGSYGWSFGDAKTDTLKNPSHTYAKQGNYTVTLSVTNDHGCSAAKSKSIFVDDNPSASFSVTNSGNTFDFLPANTGYSSYVWNFGDGNNSTSTSPSHTYSGKGTYKVTLSVDNGKGCTDTFSKFVSITGLGASADNYYLNIFPNPFTQSANISYSLTKAAHVNIQLTDVVGRTISTLADAQQTGGEYQLSFTAPAAGVYFVRISIGDAVIVKQVMMTK